MIKRQPRGNGQRGKQYTMQKKIKVVTQVLATGNMRLVADLEGVSHSVIRHWKTQPWWKELSDEIKASQKLAIDSKLTRIVNKALDTMEDRLDKGDYIYNQKTGEISRKPVSLKEARGAANDLLQRQAIIEKLNLEERNTQMKQSVNDQLEMLKQQFASFQTGRTIEVVPNVIKEDEHALHEGRKAQLQSGVGVGAQEEAQPSEGEGSEEFSESGSEGEWDECDGEGCGPQEASEQGWDELLEQFEGSEPRFQS